MTTYSNKLITILNDDIDDEINDLGEIIDILTDGNAILDTDTLDDDVKIIYNRQNMYKDFKNMILKASLRIDGVDNEIIMTTDEKKIFYWFIKRIMFFRKLFRINK